MEYALIVAGGKGLRMGTELPKQFLPIGGKPVLMRTLEAFYDYNAEIRIILVLPHSQQDYWRLLCREYRFSLPHAIADGGETRFHSVKNGLALVKTPALVGVHDGVRPFVAREVIARCYDLAAEKKVEALGVSVFLTPGNRENIKITTPFDLKIATALIGSCSI